MEEKSSSSSNNNNEEAIDEKWLLGGTHIHPHWWWIVGSTAQLGWGIRASKKGCAEDCRLMPVKAFGVASLFVGALASATVGALKASGIHTVEDMKEVGANIRTGLRVPPRKQAE